MSLDSRDEIRDELLDDFYAECDELLGNVRTQLIQLETACREGRSDPAALEVLYRCAHSLKGNAAIVGLRAAEQLSHSAEELLRGVSRGELSLSEDNLELLGSVSRRLEEVVTAHRLRQPIPEVADLIERLEGISPAMATKKSAAAAAPEEISAAKESGATSGALMWHATFSPSPELDRRGVSVTTVRSRLSALGTIVSAVPAIKPGGKMTFEFMLALPASPVDPDSWAEDGILLRPENAAEPASIPSSPAEVPAGAAPSNLFIAPSHIVRVDLSRLDDLMRIVGEMVIHRSHLEERIAGLTSGGSELQEVNIALGRSLRELRESITRVRLVPVAEIFARSPFVVRDLAREAGKDVRVVLEGQETEIDKYLVERLKEPLLHLVRNAISHGVETADDRERRGKPRQATLTLSATTAGQFVLIQVADDGRGIDLDAVETRAAAAGIPLSEQPTDVELLAVICRSGFSTRAEADRAAGRGVGMAVVHSTVRELSGSLSLENQPGRGTRFTLRLPLTLSITEAFIVSAADQICAVPQAFIDEIIEIDPAQTRLIQQTEIISYRDGVLPLVHLRRVFHAPASTATQSPVLVLSSEQGSYGLVVDKVEGRREVVVHAIRDPLIQVSGVAGATELGDGRPVLILDAVALSNGAVRPRNGHSAPHRPGRVAPAASAPMGMAVSSS